MDQFQKPLTALILVLGAIVVVAMLMAANRERSAYVPELDNPNVLRVYAVPTERAQDIRVALSAALATGNDKTPSLGRVTLSGTNQLVVLAPLQTHASIETAIQKLGGGHSSAAASDASVRLTVWLVDAQPGGGADDAALAALAPALEAARGALGGVRFALHDVVSVDTIPNGGEAQVQSGRGTHARAHLRPIAGGVQAELEVGSAGPGQIRTTTALPFGRTLVLAQLAAPSDAAGAKDGGTTRLYIVRAEPADASG